MKRLKIMQDVVELPKDPLGMNGLQDRLKEFCREQGLKVPQFWIIQPDGYYMSYAVSLHLNGNDRWEKFDAQVIYLLRDLSDGKNREVEKRLLEHIIEELGEPFVLTLVAEPKQLSFLNSLGLIKMPVAWSDNNQMVYEVFARGNLEMGGFVNLMERVEYIGKEYVYTK